VPPPPEGKYGLACLACGGGGDVACCEVRSVCWVCVCVGGGCCGLLRCGGGGAAAPPPEGKYGLACLACGGGSDVACCEVRGGGMDLLPEKDSKGGRR
jgi:hypothetical protein